MYCMNCGKEIGGNIPVCGECLQSILDKYKAEQDILTRVNLEAQPFMIDGGASMPASEEPEIAAEVPEELESLLQDGASELPDTPRELPQDDSDGSVATFIAILLFLATLGIIIAVCQV